MSEIFRDSEHFCEVLVPFFNKLKDDPEMGPKVLASELIIQFIYREPDAIISIDCPNSAILQGEIEQEPDVTMSMAADTAHRFWLGNVNLVVAMTRREIVAKGPISKIMKLLPIIKNSYAMYREHLKDIGMEIAPEEPEKTTD